MTERSIFGSDADCHCCYCRNQVYKFTRLFLQDGALTTDRWWYSLVQGLMGCWSFPVLLCMHQWMFCAHDICRVSKTKRQRQLRSWQHPRVNASVHPHHTPHPSPRCSSISVLSHSLVPMNTHAPKCYQQAIDICMSICLTIDRFPTFTCTVRWSNGRDVEAFKVASRGWPRKSRGVCCGLGDSQFFSSIQC